MSENLETGTFETLYDLFASDAEASVRDYCFDYDATDGRTADVHFKLRGAIGSFAGTLWGMDVSGGLTYISDEPLEQFGRIIRGYRYKTRVLFRTLLLFFSDEPIRSGKYSVSVHEGSYDDLPRLVLSADWKPCPPQATP